MNTSTKDKFKKFFIYFFTGIILTISLTLFYINIPVSFTVFDNKLTDYMFNLRGEVKGSKDIVIVDIDEKSLSAIGQWPWSRDVVSELIEKMTNYGAGIIGFDIVFAEYDRTSPSSITKKLHLSGTNIENPQRIKKTGSGTLNNSVFLIV